MEKLYYIQMVGVTPCLRSVTTRICCTLECVPVDNIRHNCISSYDLCNGSDCVIQVIRNLKTQIR